MHVRSSKYNNRYVREDGYTFDSDAEYMRYRELKLLAHAQLIADLVVHPTYELVAGFTDVIGTCAPIYYELDFRYREDGRTIVEDVKGFETDLFKLKSTMFRSRYPNIELRIIKVGRTRKKSRILS